MPGVPLVVEKLRSDFLSGQVGDYKLIFTVDGADKLEKNVASNVFECIPYFKAQGNFVEGSSKEIKIDLTDFYVDCRISLKDFVDATFLVIYDGDCELPSKEYHVKAQYAIALFREYLGLPFSNLLGNAGPTTPAAASDISEIKDVVCAVLRNQPMLAILETNVKVLLESLWKKEGSTFHEQCQHIYEVFGICLEANELRGARLSCIMLCDKFVSSKLASGKKSKGFGGGLVDTLAKAERCELGEEYQSCQRFEEELKITTVGRLMNLDGLTKWLDSDEFSFSGDTIVWILLAQVRAIGWAQTWLLDRPYSHFDDSRKHLSLFLNAMVQNRMRHSICRQSNPQEQPQPSVSCPDDENNSVGQKRRRVE